jgi:mannose-1-phosphate guanylyltransferase
MRSVLFLLVLTATASAGPSLAPLNRANLPKQCQAVATEPASARTLTPRYAAYTSAANCMAMVSLKALRVQPNADGVKAIDRAIQPSIDLLDGVIRSGDPAAALIAQYSKADLYRGAMVVLLSPEHQLDDVAFQLTRGWRDQSAESFAEVARLENQNPGLESNPVVAYEINEASRATAVVAGR